MVVCLQCKSNDLEQLLEFVNNITKIKDAAILAQGGETDFIISIGTLLFCEVYSHLF